MGVKLREHAIDIVLRASAISRREKVDELWETNEALRERGMRPVSVPSSILSPSAFLLLQHMALSVYESRETMEEDNEWNKDAYYVYYEGLAKRARALGYFLPLDFHKEDVMEDSQGLSWAKVDTSLYNAARMASDRALRELVKANLIRKEKDATAGRAARYELDFATFPCMKCTGHDGRHDLGLHFKENDDAEVERFRELDRKAARG